MCLKFQSTSPGILRSEPGINANTVCAPRCVENGFSSEVLHEGGHWKQAVVGAKWVYEPSQRVISEVELELSDFWLNKAKSTYGPKYVLRWI